MGERRKGAGGWSKGGAEGDNVGGRETRRVKENDEGAHEGETGKG